MWLRIYAKVTGKNKRIQAGEYCFKEADTLDDVLKMLVHGKVFKREFTLPPGITYAQLLQLLERAPSLEHTSLVFDSGFRREGSFFPDTYFYQYPDTDQLLLKRAHDLMLLKLSSAWEGRDASLPYHDPYEALIVASIIEKESASFDDRRLISGVIINRLKQHMRLQMDPTVMYGLSIEGKSSVLDKAALKYDTPYNTYLYEGLPPTPICMPSLDAIDAALHPTFSNYLYFVSKGDGLHQFSKSLHDHNKAVQKYIRGDEYGEKKAGATNHA
jgi:UPF0755 protein